ALAGESGARCDVDPADPLRGMPGLEPPDSRGGVDRGAALGGVAGALAGLALGLSPVAGVVPVAPSMRLLADCLLLFVLGMIAGAVLGGALGPQASKHAGFRLIDEMEDGAVVVIAKAPPQLVDASERALRAAGCRQLLRLPRS
ncbi:MAG: hypothetical protein M3T49_02885, partial [Candidatus Eremiobacteraeota bacterium]|nr:hypothetical protein [Candidatus Eremiobacteraeota bacterium]